MLSPFSVQNYSWQAKFSIITSSQLNHRIRTSFTPREVKALKAIRDIGIIGSSQLRNLFFKGDKAVTKQMLREGKIIEHEFVQTSRNIHEPTVDFSGTKKSLHFYTLGLASLQYFDIVDHVNYWYEFSESELLQRLAFFKLYSHFKDPVIYRSKSPFVGTIDMAEPIDVLVVKDNTREIQQEWRFRLPDPNRRMIVLTENLNWLKPINDILSTCKVRVALESELSQPIQNIFFIWDEEDQDWLRVSSQ